MAVPRAVHSCRSGLAATGVRRIGAAYPCGSKGMPTAVHSRCWPRLSEHGPSQLQLNRTSLQLITGSRSTPNVAAACRWQWRPLLGWHFVYGCVLLDCLVIMLGTGSLCRNHILVQGVAAALVL